MVWANRRQQKTKTEEDHTPDQQKKTQQLKKKTKPKTRVKK